MAYHLKISNKQNIIIIMIKSINNYNNKSKEELIIIENKG